MAILTKLFTQKTFENVLYEWLEYKKNVVKESTFTKYKNQVKNNIIPFLGNKKFKKLKQEDIIFFFEIKKIKNLSNSTKTTILSIINLSIQFGITKKYRINFDIINIKFKKKKNEITYFSKIEQEKIISYIKDNLNLKNLIILLALFSGARIGELCALKGIDIDYVNNTININKSVQRVKNFENNKTKTKVIIEKPKTESSIRKIPVPDEIIDILKMFIVNENYYIFTGTDKPKDIRTVQKYFRNFLKKLNITVLNFHSLRHTYACRLREQKVDIKVISELLGHSNWKTTEEIYVHASFEHKKNAVSELFTLLK